MSADVFSLDGAKVEAGSVEEQTASDFLRSVAERLEEGDIAPPDVLCILGCGDDGAIVTARGCTTLEVLGLMELCKAGLIAGEEG